MPPTLHPCKLPFSWVQTALRCSIFPTSPKQGCRGDALSPALDQGRRIPTRHACGETEEPIAGTAMSRSLGLAGSQLAKRRLSLVQGRRGLI